MARNVDDLGMAKQLNKLFDDRLQKNIEISNVLGLQLDLTMRIQKMLGNLSEEGFLEEVANVNTQIEQCNEGLKRNKQMSGEAFGEMQKGATKSNVSLKVTASIFRDLWGITKAVGGTIGGLVGSIFKMGKALMGIPLGIFKSLMAEAASMPIDTSFMQAIENVRKEFGSFKEKTSSDIMGAYKSVSSGLQQISGLSVWNVFESPAEQVKYLHEMASKAGSQILQFGDEFKKSAAKLVVFDKGMGLGAENMKAMMDRASVFGTTLEKQLGDTANYALQLGKSFNISSKVISSTVGSMMKDVKNFGSLTQKEMTISAVYTKKLGLEMKDIVGVIDKFDNFDKAAESAAQLSQAFGANVDAFKLMNEQDPAKRLDDLRKSMSATGKSTENMTRQELKLLASTAGMSEEAAKLAFSSKNQGLSYDEVQKKANKAETAQMKQADAMAKLADNIERIIRQGPQLSGSFFQNFMNGIKHGIHWSQIYRTTMLSVRQALMDTFWAGSKVGRSIVNEDAFGFRTFMTGFKNMFSPANVNSLMNGFSKTVMQNGKEVTKKYKGVSSELIAALTGRQSIKTSMDNIRETFHGLYDTKSLNTMLEGGKKAARFLAKGLGQGASFVAHELVKLLRSVTEFIKNPSEFIKKIKEGGSGAKSFGGELISLMSEGFGDTSVLGDLWKSLKDLLSLIADKLKELVTTDPVKSKLQKIGGAIMTAVIGKSLLQNVPGIMMKLGPMLAKGLAGGGAGGVLAAGAVVVAAGAALVNVHKKLDKFEKDMDVRKEPASKKVGAYGASMLQGLTLGLVPDNVAVIMGNKIAELADAAFGAIRNVMGGPFTDKMQSYFSSHIDFLGSVGGLIGALFSGDSSKIADAARDVGNKFVTLFKEGFNFLISEAPKIFMKVSATLNELLGSLLSGLGQAIVDVGEDIPILGSGIQAIGYVVQGVGWLFTKLGQSISNVFEKIKSFDISAFFDEKFTKIKLGFVDMAAGILNSVPDAVLQFLGLGGTSDTIRRRLKDNQDALNAHLSEIHKKAEQAKAQSESRARQAAEDAKSEASKANQVSTANAAQPKDAGNLSLDVSSLMQQKKSLEENLEQLKQFATKGVIDSISKAIPKASEAIATFNTKLGESNIASTLTVTKDIVQNVNQLNETLSSDKNVMTVSTKLKAFADKTGLGKNGSYEIKNKGVQLHLNLNVSMNVDEVEKTMVLRKDSIIFDMMDAGLSPENQDKINKVKNQVGGR